MMQSHMKYVKYVKLQKSRTELKCFCSIIIILVMFEFMKFIGLASLTDVFSHEASSTAYPIATDDLSMNCEYDRRISFLIQPIMLSKQR